MVLKIVPKITEDIIKGNPGVKLLDYKSFNDICVHPFIAGHSWSYVEIVLGEGIMSGYIKQVITRAYSIKLVIPAETKIDYNIVSLCSEAIPEIAGELRKAFMTGKDVRPILEREGVEFVG